MAVNEAVHSGAALQTRHRGLLIFAVMGASFIQFLDATIANVAIPHMQTSLNASQDSVTWVLTSFIIAGAVATPVTGWLADKFGSRNLFLAAVAGFILTSMLCGISVNLTQMVIFRIFQGICAAFIGPMSQSVLLDISGPHEQPKVMTMWSMGVVIAPICGPTIGGWLTESYNWRWVFYINLPIGIPTLIVMWWLLPSRPIKPRRLDMLGYGLFAFSLATFQLMLDRGQHADWFDSWEIVIELLLAISAFWIFLVHMVTAKSPVFDRALFRDRNFATAMSFMIVMGMVMVAISALLPPMLQSIYGYSVLDTGILLAPRGVGTLLTMMAAPRLVRKVSPRWLICAGFAIITYSMVQMMDWTLEMDSTPIIVSGFVQGVGMGFLFMPLNLVAFATLPPHLRTDGSSLLNLLRNLGASVGISLITTLLSRNIQTSHADLGAHITPYSIPGLDPSSAERMGTYGQAALQMMDYEINRQAAMIAYLDDFKLMAFVVALAIPLSMFLKSPGPPLSRPHLPAD